MSETSTKTDAGGAKGAASGAARRRSTPSWWVVAATVAVGGVATFLPGTESDPPRIPALWLTAAVVTAIVLGVARTLPARVERSASSPVPAWLGNALALVAAAGAAFAVTATRLDAYLFSTAAVVLPPACAAAIAAWRTGARLLACVAPLVGVGAIALALYGLSLRPGAADARFDWIGTPFAGDPAPSAIVLGLAALLVLPGAWGGATVALARLGPRAFAGSAAAYAALGVLPSGVLALGLVRTSAGAEVLYAIGSMSALVACIVAARRGRGALERLACLVGGAAALIVGGAGVASAVSTDVAWLALRAFAVAGLVAAFAAFGLERSYLASTADAAPRGLVRAHPATFVLFAVVAFALAGAPPFLPATLSSLALGEAATDGYGREALAVALLQGPLVAAAAWLLVVDLFLTPPRDGDVTASVQAQAVSNWTPRVLALGLVAGLVVAFGIQPALLLTIAPFDAGVASDRFPARIGQFEIAAGALFALALWRAIGRARSGESGSSVPD